MPNLRVPQPKIHPMFRAGAGSKLAAGAATANTVKLYLLVPVLGASSVSARLKSGSAGTLDIFFVGPDFPCDQTVAYTSLVGTIYTTGAPTQVNVSANTEALITAPCLGENYALIVFTPSATSTVTYCDVMSLTTGV